MHKPAPRDNQVRRIGSNIVRPSGYWSAAVHAFLIFIRAEGFCQAPVPYGFDSAGNEILAYIPGAVGNYPLSDLLRSTQALETSARLLRSFHDVSERAIKESRVPLDSWQHPPLDKIEIICHGDFAPYNCVYKEKTAIGIIDFDHSRPGSKAWDLSYALYRFAPVTSQESVDGFGTIQDQVWRARRFLDVYGADRSLAQESIAMIPERLLALVSFIRQSSNDPYSQFAQNARDGHGEIYLNDIDYFRNYERLFLDKIS